MLLSWKWDGGLSNDQYGTGVGFNAIVVETEPQMVGVDPLRGARFGVGVPAAGGVGGGEDEAAAAVVDIEFVGGGSGTTTQRVSEYFSFMPQASLTES